MLDAGIVDQDIDRAQPGHRVAHQQTAAVGARQIGIAMEHPDAELALQAGAQGLDLLGVAKAVEHDIGPLPRQGAGNSQTDAAGRTGDDGDLAFQHGASPSV